MARCSLFGADFINTFDESMYSFAGDCSYLLAGDCQKHSFSLIGESGALQGGMQRWGPAKLSPGILGLSGEGKFLVLMTVPDLEDPCGEHGVKCPFHDMASLGFSRDLPMGAWWDGESLHASAVVLSTALAPGNTLGALKHQEK